MYFQVIYINMFSFLNKPTWSQRPSSRVRRMPNGYRMKKLKTKNNVKRFTNNINKTINPKTLSKLYSSNIYSHLF